MNVKHSTLLAALFAACLVATACGPSRHTGRVSVAPQHDDHHVAVNLPGHEDEDLQHSFGTQLPSNTVSYIVDGRQYSGEISTEEDLTTLYLKILGFAKLGHNVSISARGDNPQGTKTDIVNYSSTSESDVTVWTTRMVRKGYSVTIDYDKSTRTYNCTAFKRK